MADDRAAVKDRVRRYWTRRAETYDDEAHHAVHDDEQRRRWLAVLGEWAGDPARVLDVGCGTGVVGELLATLGHDVVGVDLTPAMLDRARARARRAGGAFEVHRGDAERLPVADGAVDLVAARHLLWTLPDPAAALAEWRRALAPGGRLLLIEGHWDHDEPFDEYEEIHDDLPLYDGRPAEALRGVLEREGFRTVDHQPLTDPVLWGREPEYDYYVLAAERGR